MQLRYALAAMALLAGMGPPSFAERPVRDDLAQILASPWRDNDRPRDPYRHPAQTIEFFDIRPGMTVGDYMPAGGFYTRILVPYLGRHGRYVGLTPDPASTGLEKYKSFFANLPSPSRKELSEWKLPGAPASILATNEVPADLVGQFDRIMIIREMHVLMGARAFQGELTRLRQLLKPDGLLCIVQHRARNWANGDYTNGSKGYMRQKDVIGLAEAYGFELARTSEINANPRDSADYPGGVWDIPPVMAGSLASQAVGDSDRMTLVFRRR